MQTKGSNDFETLTLAEFCSRLGIDENTVYNWRVNGWLLEGPNFIKIRSVVRYFWSERHFLMLQENFNRSQPEKTAKAKVKKSAPSTPKLPGARFNENY